VPSLGKRCGASEAREQKHLEGIGLVGGRRLKGSHLKKIPRKSIESTTQEESALQEE